jgi:hypothetical protein
MAVLAFLPLSDPVYDLMADSLCESLDGRRCSLLDGVGFGSDGGRLRKLRLGSYSLMGGLEGEPSYLFLEVLLMLVMLMRLGFK